MAKVKESKKDFKTSKGERSSYALYFAGQNVFFMLVTSFLSTYFLDIGITALAAGTMLLVVKIWDAINDPIFGGIVDKLHLDGGKFKPWLKLSVIVIPLATILIFAIPSGLSLTAKLVWGGIAYILWDTAYTIGDVPIFGIITRMTDNQNERMSVMSIGRVAGVLAAMLTAVVVPSVRKAIGGWLPTVIVFTIIAVATMIPMAIVSKERVNSDEQEKDVSFKEMWEFLKSNKYLLIFFLAFFILQASGIGATLSMILARGLFGDEGIASMLQLMSLLPSVILGLFIPKILRKIDKYKLFTIAIFLNAVLGILIYFVGYKSLTLYLVLLAIRGIPFGTFYILLFMFTPDCVEYGKYKTGVPAEGIGFSIQSFSTKLATAVAAALGAFALAAIGFVEGEGATQLATFPDQLWMLYNLVPAAGALIALAILSRYKLRDKYVQIMVKANAGEISREEAEKQLDGKI